MSSDSDAPRSAFPSSSRASWLGDCLLILLIAGVWCCGLLGVRPLSNPDEGRYTEIPREMAASGDFVTPRLNGVKYFEKPPLLYWLSATAFRAAGLNEFTARLANGLFAVLGILATYLAARSLYDRTTGITSAIVLATSLLYHGLSQILLLDMAIAATMACALFSFLLAVRESRGKKRFCLFMAFYAAMALAILAKGLIGFFLPGAILFLWVLLLNRWRSLWPIHPVVGSILLLAIAVPWHALAARANPDFLRFYFIHEHFERFITRVHGRYEPWWYFLPVLIGGLVPWIFFAWSALRSSLAGGWAARRDHAESWFLIIWITFVVFFFSVSQSKLIPYILPVFPAAAVLIGRHLAKLWQERSLTGLRLPAWLFMGLAAIIVVAAIAWPGSRKHPELIQTLVFWRVLLACLFGAGGIVIYLGLYRRKPRLVLAAITATFAGFLLCFNFLARDIDKTPTKSFSTILQARLKPEDRIYHIRTYAQDMPAYLGRFVDVVDYEGELQFGIQAEPSLTASRFIRSPAFLDEWTQPGTAYAVIRKSDYDIWFRNSSRPNEILGESGTFLLIVNQPSKS